MRVAILALLLAWHGVFAQSFPFRSLKIGDRVPSCELMDVKTGKFVRMTDLLPSKGVVVFLFWGADSRYKRKHSVEILKGLLKLRDELGFLVYPVNVQGDPSATVRNLLTEVGYEGPFLVDVKRDVYRTFGIFVMPCVAIVKDGVIFKGFGYTHKLVDLVGGYVEVAMGVKTEKQVMEEINPEQREMEGERKEAMRYYGLGLSMLKKGMAGRAEEAFRKALKAVPDDTGSMLGLAVALYEEGKMTELGVVLEKLEEKAPNSFEVRLIKARYLLAIGKVDESIELGTSLKFSKPGSPDVYLLLGDAYYQKGDWRNAASYYKKAVEKCYHLWRLLEE